MIAYECITGTLNKKDIEYISTKKNRSSIKQKQHNRFTTWIWGYGIKENRN